MGHKTISMWSSGNSVIEISNVLGVDLEEVINFLIEAYGINTIRDRLIVDLTKGFYSPLQIHVLARIPKTTIYKTLKKLGLEPGQTVYEDKLLKTIVSLMDTGINVKGAALELGLKESKVRTVLLNAGFLPGDFLTEVEYKVLGLINTVGMSQAEAARSLGLTTGYINTVYKRALAKSRPESRSKINKIKNN